MKLDLLHDYVNINGIRLHVVKAGPTDGPLVLLLHGFPEFWYGWRRQIPVLADAGYRVWVPDQRGYNLSDKPRGVDAYGIDLLADDVVGLAEASGRDQVCLVGHDFGAAVAWWVARLFPDRIKRLVVLNVPHGSVMQRHLKENRAQIRRSWYISFFQIPAIPELALRARDWRLGLKSLQATSGPGSFSDDDLRMYRRAWSRPGAMTAMINWYRALRRARPRRRASPRVRVPTLMIWGARDVALGREMAQPSIDYCEDGRLVFLEEATHWVQHDEPERVNTLLTEFLSRGVIDGQ
jgi:pimeloyl-ACP methyl ester carboxylesterase